MAGRNFFLVLASFIFPVILLSQHYKFDITFTHQAIIVLAASIVCQLMRKRPLSKLFDAFNIHWIKLLLAGIVTGAVSMFTPTLFLFACGWVNWQKYTVHFLSLLSVCNLSVLPLQKNCFSGDLLFSG